MLHFMNIFFKTKSLLVFTLSFFIVFTVVLSSCKKDNEVNPFDDESLKAPAATDNSYNPDPNSFAGIYNNVFKPTCANSGCHDGTFVPDFRTLNSAYNTLVYQPVKINNASLTYTYLVVPYNATQSLLRWRLVQFPNNDIGQGRMPWVDTNWYFNSTNQGYIQNIVNWINNGAKDMYGNVPTAGNKEPKTMGLKIYPTGNTTNPYPRVANDKPIEIPANSSIDVWTYITDDSTSAQNLVVTDIKFSTKPYDFSSSVNHSMLYNSAGISATDMFNAGPFTYTHRLSNFSLAGYPVGTILYIRTYIRDTSHSTNAEIPNDGTIDVYLKYYTIKII